MYVYLSLRSAQSAFYFCDLTLIFVLEIIALIALILI